MELPPDDPKIKQTDVHRIKTSRYKLQLYDTIQFNKFSTWNSLVRGFGRLLRRVDKQTAESRSPGDERQAAERFILKHVQTHFFKDEVDQLMTDGKVHAKSCLCKLDPFLDEDGLLRVGGRMRYARHQMSLKHPILIPKEGPVTRVLILHCHKAAAHQGRGTTLGKIRESGYHVIKATKLVSSVIHHCVICQKLRGNTITQMADLPPERAEESPPFTHCGFDCFGPFTIREEEL